ncbi:MAG: histidine phosphatase family protein [Actinomycetota bacterium]
MRHGATEWNRLKRAQGQADIELTDLGRQQAEETAKELANYPIDAVYASDLRRAVDTARAIAEEHELEVTVEPAFREIDQGEWTGLTVDEIKVRWPELWGDNRHYHPRPGGESPEQVLKRALQGLARVVESHSHGTIVVVSHGGTIRWLSAAALGYDFRTSARIRGLYNGDAVSVEAKLSNGQLVLTDFSRLDRKSPDRDDPNT